MPEATLRTTLGIEKSAPVISRLVTVVELDHRPLTLLGIDPFSEIHFRNFKFNGSAPGILDNLRHTLVRGNGIIMDQSLAASHGLASGDELTLAMGSRQIKTRIGALVSMGNQGQVPQSQMMEGILLSDIALAQELLGMADAITRIDLNLEDPHTIKAVRASLEPGLFLSETDGQNQAVRSLSASFETSLAAFSVLVLFMGIFLIYNTVSFSVSRRYRLNGTLRALGATRQEIFFATLAEIIVYAVAGAVLGLIFGMLLGKGAVQVVCTTVSQMYYTLTVNQTHITSATLAKGMITGVGAALTAAMIPAINAAAIRPVTLMQASSPVDRLKRYIPKLTAAGLILLVPALWIFSREGLDMVIVFMGVFMVFGAAALIAPAALNRLAIGLSGLFSALVHRSAKPGAVAGMMAAMAVRNLKRALGRTSVLITSLMVVISVYIGIDTMTLSFRESIINWIDGNIGGDIHITSLDELHPQLENELLPKIQSMAGVQFISACNIHKTYSSKSGQTHLFSYITDGSQKEWTWLAPEAGQGSEADIQHLLNKDWIIFSEIFAKLHGISPGTKPVTVEIETQKGMTAFRVAGIFRDFVMEGGRAVVGRRTMKTFWGKDEITSMQIFLSPDGDRSMDETINEMIPRIRSAARFPNRLKIISGPDLKQRILSVFDNTFLITTVLQFLTAIVALTGIINSVMALILERTREIGILRACGAAPVHIRRLVLWECGLCGFLAGALAIPLGLFLSWVLVDVVNFRAFGWTYDIVISPATLLLTPALSTLAALGAGLVPAMRAGQVKVAHALRME